jgi:magnesium transporter
MSHSRQLQGMLGTLNPFKTRKQRIMNYNPATGPSTHRLNHCEKVTVFNFNATHFEESTDKNHTAMYKYIDNPNTISWVNVDGLHKETIHEICTRYGIHPLLEEDIFSSGQRAKMDEIGEHLFCLLPMVYFNEESSTIEQEQVSIIMGTHYVISFQEEAEKDVFDLVREKLRLPHSRIRNAGADYLLYSLLDVIVDSYFSVMEKLGERIELMEDLVQHKAEPRILARINFLRRELMFFKRAITPVRELVNGFMKSESDLLNENTLKYFKDVYDHIVQATELTENYRDVIVSIQEQYHTQINLKMNDIMKVLAVVTTLMAPLTLVAGIYGMNFDNMPELHTKDGYYVVMGVMVVMLVGMIIFFRRKRWF